MLDGIWQQDCSALVVPEQRVVQRNSFSSPDWRRWPAFGLALLLHGMVIVGMWQWAAASALARPPPPPVFTVLSFAESPATLQPTPPVQTRLAAAPVKVSAPVSEPAQSKQRVRKAAATAHTIEAAAANKRGFRSAAAAAPQSLATVALQTLPDTAPAYLDQPLPSYPGVARRRGLQGVVLLQVDVAADGAPLTIIVQRSSGHVVLDDAARAAVRNWRFMPARQSGRSVRASVQVPIRFHLDGGAT